MGTEGVSGSRAAASYAYNTEVEGDSIVVVQIGESEVRQVAKRMNVDPDLLLQVNPQIKDPAKLLVGQEIHLPQCGIGGTSQPPDLTSPVSSLSAAPMGDPLAKSAVQANLQSKSQDAKIPT